MIKKSKSETIIDCYSWSKFNAMNPNSNLRLISSHPLSNYQAPGSLRQLSNSDFIQLLKTRPRAKKSKNEAKLLSSDDRIIIGRLDSIDYLYFAFIYRRNDRLNIADVLIELIYHYSINIEHHSF